MVRGDLKYKHRGDTCLVFFKNIAAGMGVLETLDAIARARGYVARADDRRLFDHDGGTVLVLMEDKLTLSVTRACAAHVELTGAARLIVVLAASPTSAARATLVELAKRPVEFFTSAELTFDIMRHELVPRYELLAPDEIAALLARYRIKQAQLPRMHATDPCARYLGLARGQVVRVIREHASVGYRIVA